MSKLSRSRSRKKATQSTNANNLLNDSSDDFSSLTSQHLRPDSQVELVTPPICAQKPEVREITSTSIAISETAQKDKTANYLSDIFVDDDNTSDHPPASLAPPDQPAAGPIPYLCPLCNKQAQPGHLKSCGIKHGLTTQQVVELRRMEERHREDRRKLGVPEVPVIEAQEKSSKVRVTRKKAKEKDAGVDPDLALAMALSISAAASSDQIVGVGVLGVQVEMNNEAAKTEVQDKMWLPQVQQLKRRGKRVVGQTALQSRSEGERLRIIGEKVARVLEEEMVEERTLDRVGRSTGERPGCGKGEDDNHFWSLPARLDTVKITHLVADKLQNFLDLKHFQIPAKQIYKELTSPSIHPPQQQPSVYPVLSLTSLSTQWLSLLQSTKNSDMTILCKGELEVFCHSLVITVRCPSMMKNIVKEGTSHMFLVMDQFDQSVVKVMLHYLYGGVLNTVQISDKEHLVQLRKIVAQFKMVELNNMLGEFSVEEIDETEEEIVSHENGVGQNIGYGTQSLDVLLDCLDKESREDEHVEGEEWEEVCEYMTQRSRSVISEAEVNDDVQKFVDLNHEEQHEVSDYGEESDQIIIESEPELSLRLEESFKSDSGNPLTSVEKLRDNHTEQDVEHSLRRADNTLSCSVETVPTGSFKVSSVSRSRSSSPDMFDMSDEDEETLSTDVGVKRKSSATCSPSPHKRPCLDISSDSLPTPTKYTARCPVYDDQVVDLTQPTPPSPDPDIVQSESPILTEPDDNILQIESPTNTEPANSWSPSSPTVPLSPHLIIISSPSPPQNVKEYHDVEMDEIENPLSPCSPADKHTTASLSPSIPSPVVTVKVTTPVKRPPDDIIIPPPSLQEEQIISLLSRLSSLLTEQDSSPSALISGLVNLATVPVTVPALMATGVGKVVRKLKDRDGKVGRLAGKLVSRWKRLVLQYDPTTAVGEAAVPDTATGVGTIVKPDEDVHNTDQNNQVVMEEVISEEHEIVSISLKKDIDVYSEHSGGELQVPCDEEFISSPVFSSYKRNISRRKSQSMLEQTGLASQPLGSLHVDELRKDCPSDRDDVWDGFDEGGVSFGTEHVDNYALAEESEMWTSDNDPEADLSTVKHPSYPTSPPHPTNPPKSHLIHPCSPHPTPIRSSSEPIFNSPVPVTPLPDYQTMLTPHLKAELKKFGLKAVPRRKACLLLNHIYDQTHPMVPSTPFPATRLLYRQSTAATNQQEDDSDTELSQTSQVTDMPEESMMYEHELEDDCTQSQVPASATLHEQLSQFLHSRPSLLQSLLLYQPLWLGQLAKDVKEAGIKCKAAALQDWLDMHCITFRTESNRNKKKEAKEMGTKKTVNENGARVEEAQIQAASQVRGKRGRKKK